MEHPETQKRSPARSGASILVVAALLALVAAPLIGRSEDSPPDFERLATLEGVVYLQVRVQSIEPDALLVAHAGGVARVSLFDLPEEIRNAYGFDRDQAMAHYKQREEDQRAMRDAMFMERIRQQAAAEEEKRRANFDREVRREWIPVRARIVSLRDEGAMALVDRIVLKETRTTTALGGEGLPGPPKREFQRISEQPVLLRNIAETTAATLKPGTIWNGYIWPYVPTEEEAATNGAADDTPSYRTAKPVEN